MDSQQVESMTNDQFMRGAYQSPTSIGNQEEASSLIKTLTNHSKFLAALKRELRGEELLQDDEGNKFWVQKDKPMFVKLDKFNNPIKRINPYTNEEEFICNDEAINKIIGSLKSFGHNSVTAFTSLDSEEIRSDLYEIEMKYAALLFVKRKSWGIDKGEYPLKVAELKVLVKDARFMAKEGLGIKAVRTITSRIEQEGGRQLTQKGIMSQVKSPYGT